MNVPWVEGAIGKLLSESRIHTFIHAETFIVGSPIGRYLTFDSELLLETARLRCVSTRNRCNSHVVDVPRDSTLVRYQSTGACCKLNQQNLELAFMLLGKSLLYVA